MLSANFSLKQCIKTPGESVVVVSHDNLCRNVIVGRNKSRHVLVKSCHCSLWVAAADSAAAAATTLKADTTTVAAAAVDTAVARTVHADRLFLACPDRGGFSFSPWPAFAGPLDAVRAWALPHPGPPRFGPRPLPRLQS